MNPKPIRDEGFLVIQDVATVQLIACIFSRQSLRPKPLPAGYYRMTK